MTDGKRPPETVRVPRVNNRVVREGWREELGLKAQRRDMEAFTSRPTEGDGEWPGGATDLYIHNHSTPAETNAL